MRIATVFFTVVLNGFHGFRGVERETAQAIASWLQNKEFPALVEGTRK